MCLDIADVVRHANYPPQKDRGCALGGRVAAVFANRDGLKVAVIVNDMSEVNVDAQLMKNGSASLSRVDERLVEMQNG